MDRFKEFGKKAFSSTVASLTVAWSLGLTALIPAGSAAAATCPNLSAGDLFKVPNNPAVYLLNANMERLYFPNGDVYRTWYADFSGVVEIDQSCVDAYPAPSMAPFGVNYRPGSRLVKVQISNSVYAVGPMNTKHKIADAGVAESLYGTNWASLVRDISDVFWPNYSRTGAMLENAAIHDGMLVSKVDTATNYYSKEGKLYPVNGTLRAFARPDVRVVSNDVFNSIPMASASMEEGSLFCSWDASQGCGETTTPPPPPPPTGGDLKVSLAADTAASTVLPSNVSRMEFTRVNLEAAGEDVSVTGLTICRTGVGTKDDFEDVWIEVGGVQYGSERSIITGDVALITFPSKPMVIPRGGKTTVSLVGSLNSANSAGHYGALGICNASGVTASGDVMGTFPVMGNLMSFANQETATITLTSQGSDKTISVGDMNAEIGRFQLNVDSPTDGNVVLKSILFNNEGTVSNLENVLDNVKITQGGATVSAGVQFVGNDQIMFTFDDYVMEDGATQSFFIRADILSAEVNDTLQLQLDDDKDLFAQEQGSMFGIRVNGEDGETTEPASNVDLKTYTLETGDINLSIKNASSLNVAPGSSDIVLLDATLTVDSEFRADGLLARVAAETNIATEAEVNANFENVTLIIDGVTVDTVDTLTNGGANTNIQTGSAGDYYDFNSSFVVGPGTHNIRVEADVKNDAVGGDSFKVQIFSGDIQSPEYTANGDNVPSNEITGQADGSLVTIKASVLTVTRNDGFSGETIVGGSKGIEFLSFTLDANDSSDVLVTNLTFDLTAGLSGTPLSESDVTNMRLFIDGEQQGSAADLTNGTFSDVDFVIPRSGQVQAVLMLDTTTVSATRTLGIDLEAIDATDDEGNDVTVNASNDAALTSSNPESSDEMTVVTTGAFSISIDGNTPDENILVASTNVWYPVATFRITAQNEDLRLTDMFLVNTTLADQVTSSSDARIQTLGLFDANDTLRQSKTLSNGSVQFDLGNSAIVVPNDSFTRVTVKAKLNSIVDADKTGKLLRLRLSQTAGTNNSGVVVESTATGADLGTAKITVSGSTTADVFTMHRTKPTIEALAMSNGAYTMSGLSNGGNKVIYRFKVTAHSNEDVAWRGIKFDVDGRFGGVDLTGVVGSSGLTSATATNLSGFQLYEVGNNALVQNGAYTVSTSFDSANGNGEVSVVMTSGKEEVISAGSSKSYELRATVSGVINDQGDFVDVSIDNQSDDLGNANLLAGGFEPDAIDGNTSDTPAVQLLTGSAVMPYTFLWSDNSGSPHELTDNITDAKSRDWSNDRLVDIDTRSWNSYSN